MIPAGGVRSPRVPIRCLLPDGWRANGATAAGPYNRAMQERGVLLFAHGARDPRWAEPFRRILDRLRTAEPGLPAELAFLELMAPDLAGGVAALAARGCRSVVVVPLFLGTGGHLREDLPRLLDAAARAHPGVAIRAVPAIGEQDAVADAIARACAALARA